MIALRPEVQHRFPILTGDFIAAFLDRIQHIGTRVDPVPALFEFPRDPDDEPYLNLAAHGAAQYLVTRDRNLLDFAESTSDEARRLGRVALRRISPCLTTAVEAAFDELWRLCLEPKNA